MLKLRKNYFFNALLFFHLLLGGVSAPLPQLYGLESFDDEDDIIMEDLAIDDKVYVWPDEDDEILGYECDDADHRKAKNGLAGHLVNNCNIATGYSSNGSVSSDRAGESPGAGNQSHLDIEPTAIVNKSVNAITGHYIDNVIDFRIEGAEPFVMQRSYVSSDPEIEGPFGTGWNRNYFGLVCEIVQINPDKCVKRTQVFDSGGSLYLYDYQRVEQSNMLFNSYKYHVTNCGSGMMSARTNIKNNFLQFAISDRTYTFRKSSGEKMTYTPVKDIASWRLSKEKKLNGNELHYTYLDRELLGSIESRNRDGKEIDKLTFSYGRGPNCKFIYIKNKDKVKAVYRLSEIEGVGRKRATYITEVVRENGPKIMYSYENKHDNVKLPKIKRKAEPNERFQEIEYYRKGVNEVGDKLIDIPPLKKPVIERVKLQKAPVGHDATPIITHKFIYDYKGLHKGGITHVYNAYNHRTDYNWNKYHRLKSITRFNGNDQYDFYSREKLFWGDVDSNECTFLKARSFETSEGTQYARTFTYDEHGNVLADTLYGNLSGKNQTPCQISIHGRVLSTECEKYSKQYSYTKDDRHLLESMQEGDVRHQFYYGQDSDLLIAKLSIHEGKIFKREFYAYDENAVLIKASEDDGASSDRRSMEGVTERHIRYTKTRKDAPIGLPEVVKEKYLDVAKNKELLSKKIVYHYSGEGKLIAQDIYDANDAFLYTLRREYDERGNITKETNAAGHEIYIRYDENNNKIFEQNVNSGVHKDIFL